MKWGSLEIHLISDGCIWLDGGAMFGVVPRVFWEKLMPPDDRNRIRLGVNCLLIKTGEQNILIDTGCGNKYTEKERKIYGMGEEAQLLNQLKAHGVEGADISCVINTHLHFDHCGGNTMIEAGEVRPTFPNAVYVVQGMELAEASTPHERNRASYFEENWRVLVDEGRLRTIEGEAEVAPGVTCVPTPGHTLGHQSVKVSDKGKTIFFAADLCPTAAHVPLPWVMAYDLYPMVTLETRRDIWARAVEEGWTFFFEHDANQPLGLIEGDGSKYAVRASGWEG